MYTKNRFTLHASGTHNGTLTPVLHNFKIDFYVISIWRGQAEKYSINKMLNTIKIWKCTRAEKKKKSNHASTAEVI